MSVEATPAPPAAAPAPFPAGAIPEEERLESVASRDIREREEEAAAEDDRYMKRTRNIGLAGLVLGATGALLGILALVFGSIALSNANQATQTCSAPGPGGVIVNSATVSQIPVGDSVLVGVPLTEQSGPPEAFSYDPDTGYAALRGPGVWTVSLYGKWAAVTDSGTVAIVLTEKDPAQDLVVEQKPWTSNLNVTENLSTSIYVQEGQTRSFAMKLNNGTTSPQDLLNIRMTMTRKGG